MLDFITKGLSKLFGTKSDRDMKELTPYVGLVNAEFAKLAGISDDALRGRTKEIMDTIDARLASVDEQLNSLHGRIRSEEALTLEQKEEIFLQIDALEKSRNTDLEAVLMDVLPQAFAVVKETARRLAQNGQLTVEKTAYDEEIAQRRPNVRLEGDRAVWLNRWMAAGTEVVWDMVHYDVQIVGGVVLHQGKIAEMATGEGKTLVATFPAYLNALARRGVHIVTVNDYLAKRDSEWMGPLMEFHGLSVDCIDKHQPHSPQRMAAYRAHITYGTNNEFGFDYLRDNMARSLQEQVQRRHHFAMIDEVDSVLIDDARTPLIISGPVERGNDHEFQELRPRVDSLVDAQRRLVQDFLNEAKRLIKDGKEDEGALALFRAFRGLPKSKPLIKYLSETGIRQILLKKEGYYLQENGRLMPEADEPLFFTIDEKNNTIELTEKGIERITRSGEDPHFFVMPDIAVGIDAIEKNPKLSDHDKVEQKDKLIKEYNVKSQRIHTVNQLLKAYTLFEKDVDYVIMDGKVKIVDEQTGRIMEGRRYSDGLHQALEAKENVKIEDATQTYATITLQNYFRMYHKLAGMTGTAETEAGEFWEIYKLDVVVIPTNRPIQRKDHDDLVYKTMREKYNAAVVEIQRMVEAGRPVLVGTTSVENSEILSRLLQMRKIPHQVLNAKQHAKEAEVVAVAGRPGTVTIATNMAGRGTDIKLTPEAKQAGGLAIIGTERHESRRVDRQLRGRSGRQGDVGSSQFFVSLEDNLMRLFGSDRMAKVMDTLGLKDGEEIQHSMITKSIERAQRKVEENNFSTRKRLLEYDDVMNSQREVIYRRRNNALDGERLDLDIMNSFYQVAENIVNNTIGDFSGFKLSVWQVLGMDNPFTEAQFSGTKPEDLIFKLYDLSFRRYQERCRHLAKEVIWPVVKQSHEAQAPGAAGFSMIRVPFTDGQRMMVMPANLDELFRTECKHIIKQMEKAMVLAIIDHNWKEHLREMDDLKTQVQHAAYEQKDPLLVFKFEAFELFRGFTRALNDEVVSFLSKVEVPTPSEEELRQAQQAQQEARRRQEEQMRQLQAQQEARRQAEARAQEEAAQRAAQEQVALPETKEKKQPVRSSKTYGRNDKVTVRYVDGTVKRDVKFKTVEDDVSALRCFVVEE